LRAKKMTQHGMPIFPEQPESGRFSTKEMVGLRDSIAKDLKRVAVEKTPLRALCPVDSMSLSVGMTTGVLPEGWGADVFCPKCGRSGTTVAG
jgi:hypothetical protein